MTTRKILAATFAGFAALGVLTACSSDADVVSSNLKKEAEDFKINRRIVAVNTFDNSYVMQVTGRCSLEYPADNRVEVTCALDDGGFAQNTIVTADNVVVSSEQINGTDVDTQRYSVVFKPESILPSVEKK